MISSNVDITYLKSKEIVERLGGEEKTPDMLENEILTQLMKLGGVKNRRQPFSHIEMQPRHVYEE